MTAPKSDDELKLELQKALDQAEWAWIARHAERDAVIVVSAGIDMLDVAIKVVRDDAATVAAWVESGKIWKPTRGQLDAWNAAPDRKFMSLVVQPYVFVQEISHY